MRLPRPGLRANEPGSAPRVAVHLMSGVLPSKQRLELRLSDRDPERVPVPWGRRAVPAACTPTPCSTHASSPNANCDIPAQVPTEQRAGCDRDHQPHLRQRRVRAHARAGGTCVCMCVAVCLCMCSRGRHMHLCPCMCRWGWCGCGCRAGQRQGAGEAVGLVVPIASPLQCMQRLLYVRMWRAASSSGAARHPHPLQVASTAYVYAQVTRCASHGPVATPWKTLVRCSAAAFDIISNGYTPILVHLPRLPRPSLHASPRLPPLSPAPCSQCVLSWQRIRLANWMASSGDEWITTFARHNSGTYNNQVRGKRAAAWGN